MLQLTQTMSSIINRVETLQTQISGLEIQAPPNPKPLSSIGFARKIPEPQIFSNVNIGDGHEIPPTDIPRSFAFKISATYINTLFGQ